MRMTGAYAFGQLHDQIDAGHLIELDGKKHPLSAIRGMAYSPDMDVRRRAYEAELAAYPAIETPMAACLNAIKGEGAGTAPPCATTTTCWTPPSMQLASTGRP